MPQITRAQFLRGVVVTAVGAVLLTSCSPDVPKPQGEAVVTEPRAGGIARFSVSGTGANESLDPAVSDQISAIVLMCSVYEMLVDPDHDFVPKPMLAESWESADSKSWTFHLREGVTFHDGTEFTAEHVVYSLQRLLDETVGSPSYGRLAPILKADNIRAVDALTVQIDLDAPDANLPLVLGQRTTAIVKAGTTTFDTSTAIGTGPFKVLAFKAGQSWEVARHDGYWQKGLPYLDGIACTAVSEQSTKVQTVTAGDAHVCDAIDLSAAARLESENSGGVALQRLKDALILNLVMDSTQEPFDDPRVVQALKLATDRETIYKLAYREFGSLAADAPAPLSDPFFPAGVKVPSQNLKKAKQLLKEAGYPNGIDLELFTTQATGGMVDFAVTFAKTVEAAGIRVTIEQRPVDTYFSDVWLKKPFYTNYWGRRHTAETINTAYVSSSPWNETRMNSPELDATMTAYAASADPAEQKKLLGEALTIIAEQGSTIIPSFVDSFWLTKKQLVDVELSTDRAALFTRAYLTE